MQEHFIPQDISNYRFHLIGELDLKQFLEIMAGVVLGFLVYKLGLPGFITWPIVILCVGLGLIAALVPIADQPLTHWLSVFFKLLYSPTKFYWRRSNVIPAYFTYELKNEYSNLLSEPETFNSALVKQHRALDYFTSLEKEAERDNLEVFDQENVNSVLNQFTTIPETKAKPATHKKVILKPSVQEGQSLRIRPIITPTQENIDSFLSNTASFFKPTKVTTKITGVGDKNIGWPNSTIVNNQSQKTVSPVSSAPTTVNIASVSSTSIPTATSPISTDPAATSSPITSVTSSSSTSENTSSVVSNTSSTATISPTITAASAPITSSISDVTTSPNISISSTKTNIVGDITPFASNSTSTSIPTNKRPPTTSSVSAPLTNSSSPSSFFTHESSSLNNINPVNSSTSSITSPISAAVTASSAPNIISDSSLAGEKTFLLKGKVVDSQNHLISDAILSVKDMNGNLKFILRSDENGNFISSRPLDFGKYAITVKKDSFVFPETLAELTDEGLPPFLLKAN